MPALGIDLGTTFSSVGFYREGRVDIISNAQGRYTTPSYVAFMPNECLVGISALKGAIDNPENTLFDSKRILGRRIDDMTIVSDKRFWPFEVTEEKGRVKICLDHKDIKRSFFPEEISALLLMKMKEISELYIGEPVTEAVITVPACFNDKQRQATKDAATMAGLKVLRLINEPSALAIAYGLEKCTRSRRNVLIYDLGGGTLDVAIIAIQDKKFEVLTLAGNSHLGGQDFDNRLVEFCIQEFARKHKKNISRNMTAIQRLRVACSQLKRTLSGCTQASIALEKLHADIDFFLTITRSKFEEICDDLFRATITPVVQAVKDANLLYSDVHEIVMAGGSTRIPKIQTTVRELFNNKELNKSLNAEEAAAYGAAVYAAVLQGDKSETLQDLELLDVTPYSIGVETSSGVMTTLIPRYTRLPLQIQRHFTTSVANQVEMLIKIFEGERALTRDNNLLGEFTLTDITPAPCGMPEIQVIFNIDQNGIFDLNAFDVNTGHPRAITMKKDKGCLNAEELEYSTQAVAKHKASDEEEERKKVAARNRVYSYIYAIKAAIGASGPTTADIPPEDRQAAKELCDSTFRWLASNPAASTQEYKDKLRMLQEKCVKNVILPHLKRTDFPKGLSSKSSEQAERVK
ncbi:unnamed protein product [Schistocephalus solidus]|uniref:Heat shock cognate protein n=2 Tax=Schistocephalus solidus TaxID=70667 RepID=A0A183T5S1_SCHSO|nr:unnamed protein product [Schistocephalus solidus]